MNMQVVISKEQTDKSAKKLKRVKRERLHTIALIQIGTFLEYFDLYLYIHMAVVLNTIFFPKTDPYTTSLLAAFTFSSTYLLRPLGALVFGYIGDRYGRKATVIITTTLMAFCSFTIASLPSYSKIGLTASITMILCRLIQGFSSIGEIVGARIYMMETASPPRSYFYTTLVDVFSNCGSAFALLIGSIFLFIDSEDGWRLAFYFGAGIAVVGSIARYKLRETPEFLQKKSQWQTDNKTFFKLLPSSETRKNFLCYLGVDCLVPICFYINYIYFGEHMRNQYGLTPAQVIHHNFFIAVVAAVAVFMYARLSLRFNPLKIIKVRGLIILCYALCLPLLFKYSTSVWHIFFIQFGLAILREGAVPAHAIFMGCFPTIGRYTQAALSFAFSRLLTTLVTSYGCVYLGQHFGFEGIVGLLIVCIIIFLLSIFQFRPIEKKTLLQGI